jgi:N-methylhydantoinase B/oxoprolinase/acetone carboxylase alpha subunit
VSEIRKAAQTALDAYVAEQRAGNETLAMAEDRLIKAKDQAYGVLYSAGYGSGGATTKAKDGLDAALMSRAELMKRDNESVEQALARLVREGDTIVKSLYRASH